DLYWQCVDYSDAYDRMEACRNTTSDALYQEAYAKEQAGSYLSAIKIYESLQGYKDSNDRINICSKNAFNGSWRWISDVELYGSSPDVYYNAWNIYDTYYKIDFDAKTITLYFSSTSKTFEQTHDFEIISPTTIKCKAFRGEGSTWYFHLSESEGYLALTINNDTAPGTVKSMSRVG
ncbi:MAG: hypothetical protein IJA26_01250, partial [Clostridia bacterium]|nr:hypothetical protein [Clostridia bacterium]